MTAKFADAGSHGLVNNLAKGPLIPLTGENFNFAKQQFCLINQVSDEVIVHVSFTFSFSWYLDSKWS